ncbi:hypothetical protein SNE40_012232 [Patella caerulea]|uniref:Alpha-2-macroglobulin n=1 Tax=Patella caerulea TaxID=87958 RepID=A0AAN8JNC1_PATCE
MESGTDFRLLLLVSAFLCLMSVANSGYVVTMPKDIQIGRETSICFSFHNSKNYVKFNLRFSNVTGTYMIKRGNIGYARIKCFEFTIPTTQSPGRHKIAVTADDRGRVVVDGELTFDVTDPILTFIQTDKPAYKPGQTVKFRVLVLNTDLMQTNKSVSSILIKDPEGVIMKQWLNVTSLSGLISLEFLLSKEPVLGTWKIVTSVGSTVKSTPFKIEEYVLPKFELTISPPPYITIESETIEGEVCAMYTYGQPVKGRLKMTACVETAARVSPYVKQRPCIYFYSEIDGCHQFSVNTSQLELNMKHFPLLDSVINMTASVLDNATDIVISKSTNKTIISLMDLFLDIKTHSEPFYKPGLPYHIKVKATDLNGKPAIGRTLAIRAEELGFDTEIVTDDNGYGIHTFPAMTSNATEIVLKVIGVDIRYSKDVYNEYSLITPGASLVIEPWYSSTRSYLKITPPEKPAKCNSTVTLEVSMTQAPEKSFRLYVMVLSRGRIVGITSKGISKRDRFEGGCQEHNQFDLIDCIVRKKLYKIKYSDVKVESILVDVKVDKDMAPRAEIIMYYVHDFGEVVSDVTELTVTDCDSHSVNLEFGTDKEYPGYETTLTLQAEPGSVCGLGVIDKTVTLLGQVNTITQSQLLKASDIYKVDLFDPLNENYPTHKDHCKKWLAENEPPRRLINTFSDKTIPKSEAEQALMEKVSIISSGWYPDDEDDYYYRVEHTDASQAFKTAGVVYLTDLKIDNRPCKEVWKKSYISADDSFSGDDSFTAPSETPAKTEKKKQVAVRDFFPETWLWNLETVGETGKLVMNKELPHTITKWLGNAVCTHIEKGVGISNDAAITTFQPFFTSFNLPYSAIRGEFIPIKVTTFNYFAECVQIRLELKSSEFIDIDPDVGSVTSLCICSNEAKSHSFIIVPKKIGEINLTVVAESVAGDSRCSGFDISTETVGVQDTVIRPLLVEPEGTEKEYTYGTLVCPEEYSNGQYRSLVDLPIPRDHVPDSARGFVSVIGDLMGPSLNSATDLLRLPYGCGEQNMIVFAPNIYVMKYTKSTGQMDSIDSESIKKFLVAGYQRELRYKRSDHSFSAFGQSDDDGSTWLTVFVAKCFHKASEFIFVDKLIISRALDWATVQYNRGSFRSRGRVIHGDMKGGIAHGSADVLSAYILTVMLETGYYAKTDSKVVKGVNYLKVTVPENTYGVAVYTYLAALYEPRGSWHQLLVKELESRATVKDNMMFWKTKPETSTSQRNTQYKRASALDIEITAYALLAYQTDSSPQFTKMLRIVRWLTEQQNPNGGFMSTQDTIVALQALSSYAAMMFKGAPSLNVFIDTFDYTKTYDINSTNSLVQQTTPIIAFPTSLTVMAKGTGCSVLQATVRYNMIEDREKIESFTLNVTVNPSQVKATNCKRRSLSICTSFLGAPESNKASNNASNASSNMAVVFAKMPTGWLADMDTVNRLEQKTSLFLKRTEVDSKRPDVINFYFDQLDGNMVCFAFDMVQEIEVKNLKPAYVSVYDYYDPDMKVLDFYEIGPDCQKAAPRRRPSQDSSKDTRNPDVIEFYTIGKNLLEERNLIDNTLIARPTTVLAEKPTSKTPVDCPVCEDLSLKEFVFSVCNSSVAYSAMGLRSNKIQLLADLRPLEKTAVNIPVRFIVPEGCECHLSAIKRKSKVLIMMAENDLPQIKKTGILRLNSRSTVVYLSRTKLKAVKAAKHSKYCGWKKKKPSPKKQNMK